jgi:hypothetical protein
MSVNPTTSGKGPWRLLVLDRESGDPKLILATVCDPLDVCPAGRRATTGEALGAAQGWLLTRTGQPGVTLTPLTGAEIWRVDAQDGER